VVSPLPNRVQHCYTKTTPHICSGVLNLTALLVSFVGAVILLAIMNLVRRVRVWQSDSHRSSL